MDLEKTKKKCVKSPGSLLLTRRSLILGAPVERKDGVLATSYLPDSASSTVTQTKPVFGPCSAMQSKQGCSVEGVGAGGFVATSAP